MTEFEQIYAEYFDIVYKYILCLCQNKLIAEDITQETFLKALKNIDSFNETCKLSVWLCQIAKNTYFSSYKKEKLYFKQTDVNTETSSQNLEELFLNKETAFEIHQLIHHLDEPYKEVFSLRMFGELAFLQIGELFGKSESWARVTYHRAKLKLKEDLQ